MPILEARPNFDGRITQIPALFPSVDLLSAYAEVINPVPHQFTPRRLFGPPEAIPDFPSNRVCSAALSRDAKSIALSLEGKHFEVVPFDPLTDPEVEGWKWSCNVPLPRFVWTEFLAGDTHIMAEDEDGTVWLMGPTGVLDKYEALPNPGPETASATSRDGSMVVRASLRPRPFCALPWHHNMVVLRVKSDRIDVASLAAPKRTRDSRNAKVLPRSLSFSLDGRNVGAFDQEDGHIWSVQTGAHIMAFRVRHLDRFHAITGRPFSVDRIRELPTEFELYPPSKITGSAVRGKPDSEPEKNDGDHIFDSAVFIELDLRLTTPPLLRKRLSAIFGTSTLTTENGYIFLDGRELSRLPDNAIPDPSLPLRSRIVRSVPHGDSGTSSEILSTARSSQGDVRVRVLLGGAPLWRHPKETVYPLELYQGFSSYRSVDESHCPLMAFDLSENCVPCFLAEPPTNEYHQS